MSSVKRLNQARLEKIALNHDNGWTLGVRCFASPEGIGVGGGGVWGMVFRCDKTRTTAWIRG